MISTLMVPDDELINAIRVMDKPLVKAFRPRSRESTFLIAIFDMDKIHFLDEAHYIEHPSIKDIILLLNNIRGKKNSWRKNKGASWERQEGDQGYWKFEASKDAWLSYRNFSCFKKVSRRTRECCWNESHHWKTLARSQSS